MGIADRDYNRSANAPSPARRGLTMVWVLIIANTVIHAVRVFLGNLMQVQDRFRPGHIEDWIVNIGHFSTGRALFFYHPTHPGGPLGVAIVLEVWRFVSYQFLHADWFHLFFNMFGLFVFGPIVEEVVGRRKFLAFFLVCGIFGAIAYVALNLLGQGIMLATGGQPLAFQIPGVLFYNPLVPLVGASAGVFGVIMACAYVAPNTRIDIPIPPITVRMKPLAYTYLGIAAAQLLLGSSNAGGEAAHVGGALAGYFFVRRVHLLSDFFNLVGGPPEPGRGGGSKRGRSAKRTGTGPQSGPRPATPAEGEVDRILEKVGREGMASLTEGERRTLEAESRKRRQPGDGDAV